MSACVNERDFDSFVNESDCVQGVSQSNTHGIHYYFSCYKLVLHKMLYLFHYTADKILKNLKFVAFNST